MRVFQEGTDDLTVVIGQNRGPHGALQDAAGTFGGFGRVTQINVNKIGSQSLATVEPFSLPYPSE